MSAQPSAAPGLVRPALHLVTETRCCSACRRHKPIEEFRSPRARKCEPCRAAHEADSFCRQCGDALPPSANGTPRRCCSKAECVRTLRTATGRKGIERRRALGHYTLGPTKVCPGCGIAKPRTHEHFAFAGTKADGSQRYDYACKPCRAAVTKDRYHSDPKRRAEVLARAARQRERILARCEADPEFAAQWHEKRRQWEAGRRARHRASQVEPMISGGHESIEGLPVLAALHGHCAAADMTVGTFLATTGVSPKAIDRWSRGARAHMSKVDALLIALDALWWEVYDPERWGASLGISPVDWVDVVDEVSRAFDGEPLIGPDAV